MLGSDDVASAVLAGDQPALGVAGVAIGEIRRLSEDAYRAGLLLPFEDALVGNVAAQQIAAVAEPHRPFGPAQSRGQPLHRRKFQPVFFKARIERVDRRIGITRRRPPAAGCCFGHLPFSLVGSSPGHLLAFAQFGSKQPSSTPSLRGAKRRSNPFFPSAARWIASRSLSSGARSRDPLARNDAEALRLAGQTSPRHTRFRLQNEG